MSLVLACERQGQDLFHPPSVKGWDGGRTWLNSTTVLERGNWAADVVWGNPDLGMVPYDPTAWARRYGQASAMVVASSEADARAALVLRSRIARRDSEGSR